MAQNAFRASRVDMMQGGIPIDYVDALLDDEYMADLIEQTNRRIHKRNDKLKKYFLMQKLILGFLVVQALVGCWVALYKTVLQPDVIWGANGTLQNVDMVLMLDASKHMDSTAELQHSAVMRFTGTLKKDMLKYKKEKQDEQKRLIEAKQSNESRKGFSHYFPILKHLKPSMPRRHPKFKGGKLQIATGLFNAESTTLLHNLTENEEEQNATLADVAKHTQRHYESNAIWLEAMDLCLRTMQREDNVRNRRFCAIIGDDSAMCQKINSTLVAQTCEAWPGYCPSEKETEGLGNSFIEYSEELEKCVDFSEQDLKPANVTLIMMFTVASKEEGQLRLKNPSFQDFIVKTTGCNINKTKELVTEGGQNTVRETYQGDGCERFIMGDGYEDLVNKSRRISQLLETNSNSFSLENEGNDPRYMFFLLMPLNLVIYLLWSWIVRCTSHLSTKAERAMGKKKKVIKVTKFLVEKPDVDIAAQQLKDQLTEVEMAELSTLQPMIELGAQMVLRARLKGNFIRANGGGVDGNGHPFDPNSNWTFEPVNPNEACEGTVQPGQRLRIRNVHGELLRVDGSGARYVPVGRERHDDECVEFVVEHGVDEDGICHLGDTIQIMACGTGKYLRVQKDGTCNGLGEPLEHEAQLVIDRGGQTINSGSVVTLRSAVTDAFLHGNHEGDVSALPGGDQWRFFRIERKQESDASSSSAPPASSSNASSAPSTVSIKQGDVITLCGFNQRPLAVDAEGKLVSGTLAPSDPRAIIEEGAEEEKEEGATGEPEFMQDFVIERVGMGLVKKHDPTLRAGMQVCLKPVQHTATASSELDGGGLGYLRVNHDGSVTADGRVTQREITFTIDIAKLHDMVMPLHDTLQKGDVNLLLSPLWNKSDIKKLNAMSANWTTDEQLSHFKGPVVVASDKGTYSVPKAQGVDSGWVAVVNEGVDIPKAARQAKLQGASGLIVRCEDVLSLQKLGSKKDSDDPVLPTVFVEKNLGEELDERGIVLTGCEFTKKYVTNAMRSLANATRGSSADVFKALGTGLLEQQKEKDATPPTEVAVQEEVVEEDDSNYKWKVTSNTHYLWGKKKMDVNFGKAAPPSAVKRTKNVADASASRQRRSVMEGRKTMAGCAIVNPDDFKNKRLATELSQVFTTADASEPLEQLAEESDFKIEYKFEEVQVAPGEKPEDLEEEELMEEQEAVVAKFGVPRKRFWMVAVMLVASTVLLMAILVHTLRNPPKLPEEEHSDEELAEAHLDYHVAMRSSPERAALRSFLGSVTSS